MDGPANIYALFADGAHAVLRPELSHSVIELLPCVRPHAASMAGCAHGWVEENRASTAMELDLARP